MLSKNEVIWEFADAEIENHDIQQVEEFLSIKFPQDYIECIGKNHGGHPTPEVFMVPSRGETVFNYLLSYDPDSVLYIVEVYNSIKDRLVGGVYPFADDPAGNHICFDYRKNSESPTVVFWDHELAYEDPEKGIFPICETFGELLSRLYEFEE